MTLMVTEIYDALRDAGASEEKAPRAAEVMSPLTERVTTVEGRLDTLVWMVGTNITLTLLVLDRLFLTH